MTYSGLSTERTFLRNSSTYYQVLREKILYTLDSDSVAILPPLDVRESLSLLKKIEIDVTCTILDLWYNKGIGGAMPIEKYDDFVEEILNGASLISNHIFLWGFPEIVGPYVRCAPENFSMTAWLTWYYKNCPSVIRGWRSSQNACLHFLRKRSSKLHPENFLNEVQTERFNSGNMRFIPGPSSVIEEPLIIGFVGKKERTGHPAQKPEKVFEKIFFMATTDNEVVFDPMAGSGTTAAVAKKSGRKAIVCDSSDEYIEMIEKRTGLTRIQI
jgi:site-specific DNA-methyltransferase (adenine-specific)